MDTDTYLRRLTDKTGRLEWPEKYAYGPDDEGVFMENAESPLAGQIRLYWTDPLELWQWADTVLEVNSPNSVALVEPLRLLLLDGKWFIDSASSGRPDDADPHVSFFLTVDGEALYRLRTEVDRFVVFDWTETGEYFHAGTPEGVLERMNWLHDMRMRYASGGVE